MIDPSAMQQMMLQQQLAQLAQMNSLANYQGNQLSGLLGQANMAGSLVTTGPHYEATPVTPRPRNAWYHRERAVEYALRGEWIIARMAFWSGLLGRFANRKIERMADQLDKATDEVQRWIDMGIEKEPTEPERSS